MNKKCKYCNTNYKTNHSTSLYCSKSCASKDRFTPGVNIWKNGFNSLNVYVIGLIASDGCLSFDKHSKRDNVNITLNDKELIEELKMILTPDKKIYKNNNSFSINYKNDDAIEILKESNITYNKSLSYKFPTNIPEKYLKDFIRGYFDGDGSVYKNYTTNHGKTYCYINVSFTSGSLSFLESLQKHFQEHTIQSRIVKDNRKETFYLKIYDKQSVINFKRYIYWNDKLMFLNRKFKKFIDNNII